MKKSIFTLILFLVYSLWSIVYHPLFAQSSPVPHLINFQSVLTGAAGVPLPDGFYDVDFRIIDARGEVHYQEIQKLESASGVVSAMIGSQGELNLTIFDPASPKFLEVEVLGNGPAKTMEIVTVPYSLYAEQALNVAPQSITAEAIQPGSIIKELLSEALLSDLQGTPAGANQIGVESGFLYSSGTNIQAVLKDLDTAIHQRQMNIERERGALETRIDTESATRQSEDTKLQGAVDAEVAARQLVKTELQTSILQERSEREGAVSGLQGQMDSANVSISANQNETESKLRTLEQDVDTLMSPPQVRAAGIVNVFGGNASLVWGYNVSGVSLESSRRVAVSLASAISHPYVVLTTPVYDATQAMPGDSPAVLITTTAGNSFQVNTNWAGMPSFHFVVIGE